MMGMEVIKYIEKIEDISDGMYAQHLNSHDIIFELKIINTFSISWLPIYERISDDYQKCDYKENLQLIYIRTGQCPLI